MYRNTLNTVQSCLNVIQTVVLIASMCIKLAEYYLASNK